MNGNRRTILALGAALLVAAGPLCGPARAWSDTQYSPWAYRTPYLYRFCEWVRDCKAGGWGAACYPTGPWGIQVTTEYVYPPPRKCCPPAGAAPVPAEQPPPAGGR